MLLGAIVRDITDAFFAGAIDALSLAARRHGYHLLVSGSHEDRVETQELLRAIRGRVDGQIAF